MIPLPVDKNELMAGVDAVLLTHFHFDHFDKAAEELLPKNILIFCQPGDDQKLKDKGFLNVKPVDHLTEWESISFGRFHANHAQGFPLGMLLGKSSSWFIQSGAKSVFITGDAIFDRFLAESLRTANPKVIIANTGAAKLTFGNPLTLTATELKEMNALLPDARIIAVHMNSINHCTLSKEELKQFITREKLTENIQIPNEGDTLSCD